MKMAQPDIESTFGHFTREIKTRHPDFAYLHLVESRAAGVEDKDAPETESLDFLAREWAPKPLLVAGGHKLDAETPAKKYENSVVVYGRYFISNVGTPVSSSSPRALVDADIFPWSTARPCRPGQVPDPLPAVRSRDLLRSRARQSGRIHYVPGRIRARREAVDRCS
jgi:hypothetical protein